MPYILKDYCQEIIRNRGMLQSMNDSKSEKARGKNAPSKLLDKSVYGITSIGSYFTLNILYKQNGSDNIQFSRKIYALIDQYALAQDKDAKLKIKQEILNMAGEHVESLSLILSHEHASEGFIFGNQIVVARFAESKILQPDANGLINDVTAYPHTVFILQKQAENIDEFIKEYFASIRRDYTDDIINTDVINSIYELRESKDSKRDIASYLKHKIEHIQPQSIQYILNPILKDLQKLDMDKAHQARLLIIQILDAQSDEKKDKLTELDKLAQEIYGPWAPYMMVCGLTLLLCAGFYTFIQPLMLMASCTTLLLGLLSLFIGHSEFYNQKEIDNRMVAHRIFDVCENFKQNNTSTNTQSLMIRP